MTYPLCLCNLFCNSLGTPTHKYHLCRTNKTLEGQSDCTSSSSSMYVLNVPSIFNDKLHVGDYINCLTAWNASGDHQARPSRKRTALNSWYWLSNHDNIYMYRIEFFLLQVMKYADLQSNLVLVFMKNWVFLSHLIYLWYMGGIAHCFYRYSFSSQK